MHHVRLHLSAHNADATRVFAALTDLRTLPERTPSVLSVESHRSGEDCSQLSTWRVAFGEGIMQWTEQDFICQDELRFAFKAVDGDIPTFAGSWSVGVGRNGTSAIFEARFDFELPQLEEALAPLAAQAILANSNAILMSVLGPDAIVVASEHGPVSVVSP